MSLDTNQHSEQSINQAKSEAFAEQMLSMINQGALSLMLSIGHKTHLLDSMSSMPPSTSEHIANTTGLNERYVREWLAAMVTGRIIEYDPTQRTYHLPAEHTAWLTREAGMQNMAFQMQYIVMLAKVHEQIIDCFSKGGGVPYASFPSFQQLMAEESLYVMDSSLLQVILPLVAGLEDVCRQALTLPILAVVVDTRSISWHRHSQGAALQVMTSHRRVLPPHRLNPGNWV